MENTRGTETLGYTNREMRDDKWRELKAAGEKGVCRHTTHEGNSPQIIYVVTWSTPKPVTVAEGK